MYRLSILLVFGFVFHFVLANRITDLVAESNRLIQEKGSFELLEVLHHFAAGYKAYTTNIAYKAMDDLRQSCGGAGYLL